MDAMEVGKIRFCWSCGRPARQTWGASESDEPDRFECSCCARPFKACPCSPAYEPHDLLHCSAAVGDDPSMTHKDI